MRNDRGLKRLLTDRARLLMRGLGAPEPQRAAPIPATGYIDRPGPMVLCGTRISVVGWAAGAAPVRDVTISIGADIVAIVTEPQHRPGLHIHGYDDANVFPYAIRDVAVPRVGEESLVVGVSIALVTGEMHHITKQVRIAASVGDALHHLQTASPSDVWPYITLATELYDSGRFDDAVQVLQSARARYPHDDFLDRSIKDLLAARGFIDRPGPVSMAGSMVDIAGWLTATTAVEGMTVSIGGHALGSAIVVQSKRPDALNADPLEQMKKVEFRLLNVALPAALAGETLVSCDFTFVTGASHSLTRSLYIAGTASEAIERLESANATVFGYANILYELIASERRDDAAHLLKIADGKFPNDVVLGPLKFQLASLGVAEDRPEDQAEPGEHEEARQLMAGFESLGFNCEFGLVQRHFGTEPLGLLRFANAPIAPLLQALAAEFSGMGEPQFTRLYPYPAWEIPEYALEDSRYGFTSHTYIAPLATDAAYQKLYQKQCKRVTFLKDKLVSDLKSAAKIFLYYDYARLPDFRIMNLSDAIRRYNDHNLLLCVRPQEAGKPGGTVVLVREGLAIGYIEKFSSWADVPRYISPEAWLTLCRKAQVLLSGSNQGKA